MEDFKGMEVTITYGRLNAILSFAMATVCEEQNLDYSYTEFAAVMHSEAFDYIFGGKELPEGFEEAYNKLLSNLTFESCVNAAEKMDS